MTASRVAAGVRARLAWWLGPWSARAAEPAGVARERVDVHGGSFLYRPRGEPRAAWLLSPGMHLAGPADPRVDRFARVIASAGA
ncbi:MAG TPA: hypothetical protein VHE35_37420, partial [Kofleriaceae bacterium]|nr:hypothetical protein [Kofleriaceae bacterium]